MRCSRCGVCCTETEMLLSEKDISRIEKQGFSRNKFTKIDSEGYAKLRNYNGYCVFYDRVKRECAVYSCRPAGCRVYPVIFHEEEGVILDSICESRNTILQREQCLKGKRVIKLLEVIDFEAIKRFNSIDCRAEKRSKK
jgi:Fe-S-cluster containining protein